MTIKNNFLSLNILLIITMKNKKKSLFSSIDLLEFLNQWRIDNKLLIEYASGTHLSKDDKQ